MIDDDARGDSRMPKVLKKRGKATTKIKTKAKRKPEAKRKPTKRPEGKIQKAKIQMPTTRPREPLKLPDHVKRDEPRPATVQTHAPVVKNESDLARKALPTTSYQLEVDGRLKSEYPTQQLALMAAVELKQKYPQIRIAIVDSKDRNRIPVELPKTAA
jgi:hypothetical protein